MASEAGEYTLTVTAANGCESSCSTTVGEDVALPVLECSSTPVSCYDESNGSVNVNVSGGTPPYQYNWENVNNPGVSISTDSSIDNLGEGTYMVTVTGANGCSQTCESSVQQPREALSSFTTVTHVTCNGFDDGAIDLTVSGGTPPYKFSWSNGAITEDITNLLAGNYSVTITDGNQCMTQDFAIVNEPSDLICDGITAGFDALPFCGEHESNTLQALASGGEGVYSYSWSIDTTGLSNGWEIINGSETEQIVSFIPGAGQATFSVIIYDENQCEISCEIVVEPCLMDEIYCSYTQGFYGNPGGLACIPEDQQVHAKDIMNGALINSGGQVDFGDELNGKYFRLFLSDIQNENIFKLLPGGGPSRSLTGYATYDDVTTWSNVPLVVSGPRRGKIKNNLLSQTMTLYFNLYADSPLGSYQLEEIFYTAATRECGSEDYDIESIQMFHISPDIIAYLELNSSATVQGLFELANRALGGHDIGNLSYSSISGAVDTINNGFDECRILLPESVYLSVIEGLRDDQPIFTAYPIPFVDAINIRYEIDGESEAIIQVYDLQGRIVKSVVDKDIYYHKVKVLDLDYKIFSNQMYFIKVESGGKSTLVKVISIK